MGKTTAAKNKNTFGERLGERFDNLLYTLAPQRALRRKKYQFAYDALDKTRTRRKRKGTAGTGDQQLTYSALYELRGICRELMRNNAIVKGLLKTERDGLIGSGVNMQARTADDGWNAAAEALWKEEMIEQPCDLTGRFNFNQYLRIYYLSYRRDGDAATIFIDDDTLQMIEGDQIGTPRLIAKPKNYYICNGVAMSNTSKKVLGYYIGQPGPQGRIQPASYKMYKSSQVHLMFDPERCTQSRGEPVLTSAIDKIDKLDKYIDAELVAACVNACFTMFVSRKDMVEGPEVYTEGVSTTGLDPDGKKLEKIGAGTIMYGDVGETAMGVGQTRPGTMFDPFVNKMLMFIGRPLLMPLMLVTGDFSGATYMNTRVAYQKIQESWRAEQDNRIKTFCGRVWRRKVASWIRRRLLKERSDQFRHETICKRWPYVDPWKEVNAQTKEVELGVNNRKKIISEKGEDPEEVMQQWKAEKAGGFEKTDSTAGKNKMENIARGVRAGVPIAVTEARIAMGLDPELPRDKILRFNDQDVLQYHIEGGILTINEVREVLDKPPVPWGNVPVRKTGISPVTGKEKEDEEEVEKEEQDKK